MDINSILKPGSKVDVLIRNNYTQQIGKYSLTANEPYTLLKDLSVSFIYNENNVLVNKQQGNLLSTALDYPNRITIYDVPFTDKISNLVFTQYTDECFKTNIMTCVAANNTIYFEHNQCFNMYVYNETNELLGFFAATDNYLTGPELVDNESYKVFYQYLVSSDSIKYELKTPHHTYFTVEIFGESNVQDTTTPIYLKFNKCNLVSNKDFIFNNQAGTNTVNLSFDIIEGQKDYIVIE